MHSAAATLYGSAGWHEVLRIRPAWLQQAPGGSGLDVRVMVLPSSAPFSGGRRAPG